MARARIADRAVPAGAVIVGAGPAGLCCAMHAAAGGRSVVVLEKNRAPLVKLALTGAGRCNITHAGPIDEFPPRYGCRARFVRPALFDFTNGDLVRLLARRGLGTVCEEDGRVFPATHDPADVHEALLAECAALPLEIRCAEPALRISAENGGFEVRTRRGKCRAGSLVIATGGLSYPRTGSTGDGYAFARTFGHAIVETGPALAPVIVREYRFAGCAGISIEDARIVVRRGSKQVRRSRGDLLFTHRGLSGPGMLDLSRDVRAGDTIAVSIVPFETEKECRGALDGDARAHGRRSIGQCLASLGVPARLAARILELAGIDPALKTSQTGKARRDLIASRLTRLEFTAARLGGFGEAMVTRGGVSTGEIDPRTMESRLAPGLYVVGETLDVDGDTGGYNLQWAFSSGAAAGRAIARSSRPVTA
ncbi:MAG: NAD(P)/FAD-dependent oxidoreductase [Candidatus Krumholzibacteria bacterium]|nr:NAD(P)/FAD-dependent oxidoreductase [Candidatus Krumholzibacteria bacterium]